MQPCDNDLRDACVAGCAGAEASQASRARAPLHRGGGRAAAYSRAGAFQDELWDSRFGRDFCELCWFAG